MDPLLQSAIQHTLDDQEWEDGDDEYDEEGDLDAEAEEIAKRLGDQLLADIAKAQAEAANAAQGVVAAGTTELPPSSAAGSDEPGQSSETSDQSTMLPQDKKQEAALMTVRTILSFAFKDPVVRATLNTYIVRDAENRTVLDVLAQCASTNTISKGLAKPLSDAVVGLAKSDVLFKSMRNSDAPAIQLDKGKRKRDHTDDDTSDERYQKKATIEYPDLSAQISEAVRVITSAFASHPATDRQPQPALVSSIQFQLHQIFLFVMTSVPRARPEQTHSLQELGGMIQMLGVLTGVPIGPAPPPPWATGPTTTAPAPDIGTAVYPCLVPSCSKTFHRLYSLRTHQRVHTLVDRPYRCPSCPASFHRNHDLKRHLKLHDKTAFKCAGCGKVFSRRDAIKRHKDSRGRGGKGHVDSACVNADIEEVEVDKEEGEEDASRRAKLWNGIVANQLANANAAAAHVESAGSGIEDERAVEEGEIPLHVIQQAHVAVLQVHPIIQSRVSNGMPPPPPGSLPFPPPPPGSNLPTLASVMARTQSQYNPSTPQASNTPSSTEDSAVAEPSKDLFVENTGDSASPGSISLSWLSEEQTKLLEQAIAQAAQAAQAQAEAEAALEEEEEGEYDDDLEEQA